MSDEPQPSGEQWMRNLFSGIESPPADIVATGGLTRETLERHCAALGEPLHAQIPGHVILDPDGVPVGMSEPEVVDGMSTAVYISQTEADRLGVTPGELPGVRIVPNPTKGTNND